MHNHFKMCLIILISSQKPLLLFSSKLPYTTSKKNISLNTIKIDDDISISSAFYEVILIFVRRRLQHPYIYVLIQIIENCHQHSYRFQNFMSSWGSWSKISKSKQVGDFSFFGSKSSLLVSKVSFNYVYTFRVHR